MPLATGKEMAVLKIVQTLEQVDATTICRKLVISQKYAEEIIDFLIQDGYLEESKGKGMYKITKAGMLALSPYKVSPGVKYIHA